MRLKAFIIVAVIMPIMSCSVADLVRLVRNVDMEKKGVHVNLSWTPSGMYDKPFKIQFDDLLKEISDGAVDIRSYNIYTVGNYDKQSPAAIQGVTNFIDPTSRFKDAWFGLYVIIDDRAGRKFMLSNVQGDPGDPANLKEQSLLALPEMDQKIIVWSTHENQDKYSWADFKKEFYFHLKDGTELKKEVITDARGRSWYRIAGAFSTIAALTDTDKTGMGLFTSIRSYVGLPNDTVYRLVAPWHPIVINGIICARYFQCERVNFWAVVYYNGTSFVTRPGKRVNTWEDTDLRKTFERMFDNLEIGCSKKH